MILASLVAASAAALISGLSVPGSDGWTYYDKQNGVEVYYAVRIASDEARVSWKCVNTTGQDASCSVGAGQNKVYRCVNNGSPVGFTESLGERATVRANGEYAFPSDFACRGKGATDVEPYGVRISIER
jgi:hypothetical protein